ncbi:hypothetical protein [methanotrophic endosymbiont of Bathymodiolus puteoserpentis (Logatchev)]|jgi:hypothetical protein|uniref:hypothetical protein n=1 Tax=methanotrophic endosymbiont of Bathymodiolus puteoserpentis (Logatchev) TaxID=343235 RepID=UPI0013C8F722|nr:hypothetical protein [methanotrophic endosymbiont of Bathymodiolus puteoserpentis (Logatchev)]SHE19683.1 hypothetical protein BPUTEOMOX_2478 [methanotrophic endosymbiont of Bathymodiolus puteoserpentis (Logatchev)]
MKKKRLNFYRQVAMIAIPVLLVFSVNIAADGFATWEHVSDDELAEVRGGFLLANGVEVDFSFKRQILIDGKENYVMSYQLPKGTFFDSVGLNDLSQSEAILSSVIQNNIDNRVISNITTFYIGLRGAGKTATIANGLMDFRDLMQY